MILAKIDSCWFLDIEENRFVRIHIVNPSHFSFGTAFITPRWMFVLAAATPSKWGDPILSDESLEPFDTDRLEKGDVVGIGIHTGNALVGYELGQRARERGAWVIYGGSHPTLFPEEAIERGGAHAVVKGDGDVAWGQAIEDCVNGSSKNIYEGGRIDAGKFRKARWDLMNRKKYAWASVQTVRGCPKHCSFCSVWRTDGQEPRQRQVNPVIEEIVELRRMGFRFIALADDNFYPVTLEDLRMADRREDKTKYNELKALRDERFELMELMAQLPSDLNFFTQITMESAEDPEFLDAMRKARIRGALVGVEAVTPEGLKDVYKDFNLAGEELVERLKLFKKNGVHILASFIFGLPSDRPSTFVATADLAKRADITFAQFMTLTPFPGTLDFDQWERENAESMPTVDGIPYSRHWLIPQSKRPKLLTEHPAMSSEEIRQRTLSVWYDFYSLKASWQRSNVVKSLKSRIAFVLISKLYPQMFANTGLATDSARVSRSTDLARMLLRALQRFFSAPPMPGLRVPN
ncbi:MAG: B12-binding domain-containing radical SAM protein [Pirellulales bacterium]|nr:B12-binding domain-containing radical SAM protein [Pirellulales bacterium]